MLEYISIGDTTTRLTSVMSRREKGVNIGGGVPATSMPPLRTSLANQSHSPDTECRSTHVLPSFEPCNVHLCGASQLAKVPVRALIEYAATVDGVVSCSCNHSVGV